MSVFLRPLYNRWSYLLSGLVALVAAVFGILDTETTDHVLGVLLVLLGIRSLLIFANLTRQKPSL